MKLLALTNNENVDPDKITMLLRHDDSTQVMTISGQHFWVSMQTPREVMYKIGIGSGFIQITPDDYLNPRHITSVNKAGEIAYILFDNNDRFGLGEKVNIEDAVKAINAGREDVMVEDPR